MLFGGGAPGERCIVQPHSGLGQERGREVVQPMGSPATQDHPWLFTDCTSGAERWARPKTRFSEQQGHFRSCSNRAQALPRFGIGVRQRR